jgi:hypothetical protein
MKTASILSLVLLAACGSKPPAENATDASTADTGTADTDNTETGDTDNTETGDTETGDTDSTETGDTGVKITPEKGNYEAVLQKFENDDCEVRETELKGYADGNSGFQMVLNSEGLRSTMFYPEQTTNDSKQCTMTGTAFNCEIESTTYAMKEYDATFLFVRDHSGQWHSNKEIAGAMQYRISCAGKECATANKEKNIAPILPCKTSISYSGSRH